MIWIVDADRGDGKRFVVRADEKLTAVMELESATMLSNAADSTVRSRRSCRCRTLGGMRREIVRLRSQIVLDMLSL